MSSPMAFAKPDQTVDQALALVNVNARRNLILTVLVDDHDGRRAVVLGDALAIITARGVHTDVDQQHLQPPTLQQQVCPGPSDQLAVATA